MALSARNSGGWLLLLVLAAAIVVSIGLVRGSSSFASHSALTQNRDVMRHTVQALKAENANLQQEIQRLVKSPSYARKVLRDKYHVTDQDEDIVFFAD